MSPKKSWLKKRSEKANALRSRKLSEARVNLSNAQKQAEEELKYSKLRAELAKTKRETFNLKYGKLIKGAKTAGRGAGKLMENVYRATGPSKKKKRKRRDASSGFDFFPEF